MFLILFVCVKSSTLSAAKFIIIRKFGKLKMFPLTYKIYTALLLSHFIVTQDVCPCHDPVGVSGW